MVKARQLERCLDTETLKSLHHREERECLKVEKRLLQDENRLLRDVVNALEAKVDSSFEDGYSTTSYEAIQALPVDFDLQSTLGWNREQILAKAVELSKADPDKGGLS